MFTGQLGDPNLKNLYFPCGKQAFLKKRSFASEDGRDRVLRPPLDVFGPLEGARGSGSTDLVSTQKNLVTSKALWKKFFEASRSTEGALQMAAGPNHFIFTVSRDHLDGGKNMRKKEPLTSKASLKKLFSDSTSPEDAP